MNKSTTCLKIYFIYIFIYLLWSTSIDIYFTVVKLVCVIYYIKIELTTNLLHKNILFLFVVASRASQASAITMRNTVPHDKRPGFPTEAHLLLEPCHSAGVHLLLKCCKVLKRDGWAINHLHKKPRGSMRNIRNNCGSYV